MSEPVTNAEIEDVLTAVRRLVSQSGGAKPKPRENEAAKLVLTPAFRVDADPEETPATPEATAQEPSVAEAPAAEVASDRDPVPETADAKTETDAPATGLQAGQDGARDAAMNEPGEPARDADDVVQDVAASMAAAAQDHATAATDTAAKDDTSPRSALEARIAELESVVVKAPDGAYEPDGTEPDEAAQEVVFHHKPEPRLHAVDPQQAREVSPGEAGEDDTDDTPHVQTVEVESPETDADIAAAEDWQDVEADSFAFRPVEDLDLETALDEGVTLEDTAFTRAAPDYVEDDFVAGADADADAGADADEDDDLVIDEDMLREIVARLVREELQGTMGERITRNLRRMVRREIARALALKEFE